MGEKIGYIRVSTAEQHTYRQEDLMQQLGVDRVYMDKCSGSNTDRPELNKMMEYIREGDTVIVESISRLARSTKDFLELIDQFQKKQVKFVSQKENIDTSTATGQFMMTVFAALYQLERQNMLDRQRDGIAAAKARGVKLGRKPKKINEKQLDQTLHDWQTGKVTAVQAYKMLGIGKTMFYRIVNERGVRKDGR